MSLRDQARRVVERFPTVAQSYRTLRNLWMLRLRKPSPTPHGFDLVGRSEMVGGRLDEEESRLVAQLLEGAEVFIDVGANIGLYTVLAATREKWTVAVEPLPDNLAYLTTNIALNRLKNVELFPVAVGDGPGVLPLYGGDTGASLVAGWAGAAASYQTSVAISTLDVLLGQRFAGKRVLVKMDIEGAEAGALAGAKALLVQQPPPSWLVEICLTEHHPLGRNPNFRQVFDLFWAAGYQAFTADGERRAVAPEDVARWLEAGRRDFGGHNFVFTKQ